MSLLVRDKKKPNKDPFEISEKGFEGLQKQFPGRYVIAGGAVKVTPESVQVVPLKNPTRREAATQKKREQ